MKTVVNMVKTLGEVSQDFDVKKEVEMKLMSMISRLTADVIDSEGAILTSKSVTINSNNNDSNVNLLNKEISHLNDKNKTLEIENLNLLNRLKDLEASNAELRKSLETLIKENANNAFSNVNEGTGNIDAGKQINNEECNNNSKNSTINKCSYIKEISARSDKSGASYGSATINGKTLLFETKNVDLPLVYGASEEETKLIADELNKFYPGTLGIGQGDLYKIFTSIDGFNCHINVSNTTGKVLGYIGEYCFFWTPSEKELPFIKKANKALVKYGSTKNAIPVNSDEINKNNLYEIANELLNIYLDNHDNPNSVLPDYKNDKTESIDEIEEEVTKKTETNKRKSSAVLDEATIAKRTSKFDISSLKIEEDIFEELETDEDDTEEFEIDEDVVDCFEDLEDEVIYKY